MNTTLVFMHLLGAVIWAGGVLFLGVVAAGSRMTVSEKERIELFRVLGRSFLVLAAVAATLLLMSGNLLVDRLYGGWSAMAGETRDLVIYKAVAFAAVLGLAAIHGLALGPRVRRLRLAELATELSAEDRASLTRCRRLSTICQFLMLMGTLLILVFAADLTS